MSRAGEAEGGARVLDCPDAEAESPRREEEGNEEDGGKALLGDLVAVRRTDRVFIGLRQNAGGSADSRRSAGVSFGASSVAHHNAKA